MFGVALGTVALPSLARSAARGDLAAFRASLGEGLRILSVLCLPAAAGLAICSEPIIAVIYQHGRFGPDDTHAAAIALAAYAVGLTGYAAIKILGPAFYALNDAQTPMKVSAFSVVVNLASNWLVIRVLHLGHGGLALSTSVVALWNSALLLVLLRRRTGVGALGIRPTLLRASCATAVMAAICWTWLQFLGKATGFAASVGHVASTVPLGLFAFYLAGRALGIDELRPLSVTLRQALGRRSS
jgi:putative peptidoglycan lipid II flippase